MSQQPPLTLEKGLLIREISPTQAGDLAGESAHFYCGKCGEWRTNVIGPSGEIVCPKCGEKPNWKRHRPALAYASRQKRVSDLCSVGSTWRRQYEDIVDRYGGFINELSAGLPPWTQEAGWRFFQTAWRAVDAVADYLLTARDAPEKSGSHVYTERGLKRRYSDSRRNVGVTTMSDVEFSTLSDEVGVQYTPQEVAEMISYHKFPNERFYDTYFAYDFLEDVPDPLERSITHDLSRSETKRDIERRYHLTERQVRTKVEHIRKALKSWRNSLHQ